jgi:hypothetical protein
MKQIDLHGIKHLQVEQVLNEEFAGFDFPLIVITGRSSKMKELVEQIASNFKLNAKEMIGNQGRLIVYE